LKVGYTAAPQRVISPPVEERTIEPAHPIAGDAWDVPFFYEDARHVFYVTTTERLVRIPEWIGYELAPSAPDRELAVPPLVLTPVEVIPDPIGPVVKQPGFGVIDPLPVERFMSKDAYITRGIGTAGTVRYGNKDIGPGGSRLAPMGAR
jgi:hypothetical protein